MSTEENLSREQQLALLNLETARISWSELQTFFASGKLRCVSPGLDLLDVALAVKQDQARQVETWLRNGQLESVSDQQALQWHEQNQDFWAVVIRPFIFIQSVSE